MFKEIRVSFWDSVRVYKIIDIKNFYRNRKTRKVMKKYARRLKERKLQDVV